MSGNAGMVREFVFNLAQMSETIENDLEAIWHEAAQTAAEAVVIGNEYGPGTPVDTGFLRASFRLALNTPEDGPVTRPDGLPSGGGLPAQLDVSKIARATLGDTIYLTTVAEYAQYLEEGTYDGGTFQRRTAEQQLAAAGRQTKNPVGSLKGTLGPTPFIAPVEARWSQIVDDAARRVLRNA